MYVNGGTEFIAGTCDIGVDGTTVNVNIPVCSGSPGDGLCVGASYDFVVVVGNLFELTDRAPNGECPFTVPEPAMAAMLALGVLAAGRKRPCRPGDGPDTN